MIAASLGGLALFLGLPLAALVERSLAVDGGHGFGAYRALTRPTASLLATPWEAILNSLLRATTVRGRDGHAAEAIPIDALRELLKRHGR